MTCTHEEDDQLFSHGCPVNEATSGPGVHALVIGVSHYPLRKRPWHPRFRSLPQFEDVPGCATGAACFATFLESRFLDPAEIPLRTVRLLLSPTEDELPFLPAGRWQDATAVNVRDALERWQEDCDSNHDNVAILYVAGHGVAGPAAGLFAFLGGANQLNDPYVESINLMAVAESLKTCQARSNIYIYDCCATAVAPQGTSCGIYPPVPVAASDYSGREFQLNIMAARMGAKGYTISAAEGTLFSKAFLPLLDTAGELIGGTFTITKNRLQRELPEAVRHAHPDVPNIDGKEPSVNGEHAPHGINRPQPAPSFPVDFLPEPTSTALPLDFCIRFGGQVVDRGELNGHQHTVNLPAGNYRVEVAWQDGEHGTCRSFYDLCVDRRKQVVAATGEESAQW
ncbi:caspase family protein [Amycolatopsis sp. cg5]|uniref:caspase family protein n=1 Tax=Amycolatopsis sp. cg5 TaxID=3238802 RepID=UPI00352403AB